MNADDFGASKSINAAVEQSHRSGVLTTASLMPGGRAFENAVAIAKRNPNLGVGLHLTLVKGFSVLPPSEIPNLSDPHGNLPDNEIAAGLRYFCNPNLRSQLQMEIEAQFKKFCETGLELDHVNGHLHFHLHPTVCDILQKNAVNWGITRMRLVREPLLKSVRYDSRRIFSKIFHWGVFRILSGRIPKAENSGPIKYTDQVYGLLETGRMNEDYFEKLINDLPGGTSEIYFHPDTDGIGKTELDALASPGIRNLITQRNIRLIRYSDL